MNPMQVNDGLLDGLFGGCELVLNGIQRRRELSRAGAALAAEQHRRARARGREAHLVDLVKELARIGDERGGRVQELEARITELERILGMR